MKTVAQTVIEADRFYTIAAKGGSVIQAVEKATNGGDIRLGKYEHKPEQEWAFVREGDGVYRIRNRASGKLIDLMMTGTANGTWLHLWEDVGGTSQMWTVEPTPAGTVRLRSSWASGKCIDTVGMGASDGAILQIWQEAAGDDQLWTISEVKDRAKHAPKAEEKPAEVKAEAAAPAEESNVDFTHEAEISYDDFCKVELRVAEVRACENLKESKKLLHLTVFDGERERCILSGIAKWFKPEDLIGKKLGIVCNLAPRPMLKGKYVSEGMIFAADTADGGCSIAFYGDNTPVGSRIH